METAEEKYQRFKELKNKKQIGLFAWFYVFKIEQLLNKMKKKALEHRILLDELRLVHQECDESRKENQIEAERIDGLVNDVNKKTIKLRQEYNEFIESGLTDENKMKMFVVKINDIDNFTNELKALSDDLRRSCDKLKERTAYAESLLEKCENISNEIEEMEIKINKMFEKILKSAA